jgi:hypothetical protein
MTRLATFVWRSPPPTSVDEALILEEDVARLVVRRPRRVTSAVGSYVGRPSDDDRAALLAAGPGPTTFDLWPSRSEPADLALMAIADRVAETCLLTPRAAVTFTVGVTDTAADGTLGIALLATGAGTEPVVFDIDPTASVVHVLGPSGEITWMPMPRPATGFVTVDAVGVDGVGVAARLEPGIPVATTLQVPIVPGATVIALEVAGWLSEGFPDEPMPARFAVRTADAAIPR